jgi:Zn-dependent protease with chaperone function
VKSGQFAAWRANQHRRTGELIWRCAQRDYANGTLQRSGAGSAVAHVIAFGVLLIPALCVLLGLVTLWRLWPAVPATLLGIALVMLGAYLFPRPSKLPDGVKRRADLPATFAVLDQLCARLKSPPVTAVAFDDAFNASVTEIGKDRLLTVGVVLWAALTDAERLAMLGHEIAHLVNGDPARGRLFGQALGVTRRWLHALSPANADNVFAEVFLAPFALVAEVVLAALLRQLYLASQRAEYLADAIGAEVSGG